MTRRRLCISSFQDWMGAALNRAIQGLAAMPLLFSRQQLFLATRGRGSGRPFRQRGGRRHRS